MNSRKIIPGNLLYKGPDELLGDASAQTFIYTKYPNKETGSRYQWRPGDKGHQTFIGDPEIVEAIFGPKLNNRSQEAVELEKEIQDLSPYHWKRKDYEKIKDNTFADDLSYEKIEWRKDEKGKVIYPLQQVSATKAYSWDPVRRYAKSEALIGRKGKYEGHDLYMLWPWEGPKNEWVPLVRDMINELNIPDDAIFTMGVSDQFLASDFKNKETNFDQSADNLEKNKEYLDLLQKYHLATGEEKERLKKKIFSTIQHGYPDVSKMTNDEIEKFPWHGRHWQDKMRAKKLLAPSQKWWAPTSESFKHFIMRKEQKNEDTE